MAELAFLDAVRSYLLTAGLQPVPRRIAGAEPENAGDLPAVVLSLDSTERVAGGLGERSQVVTGALPVNARIDLANPVLPEDPTVVLLDGTRRRLTLPHGGLVGADGSEGPLGPGDLTVTVGGAARAITNSAPGPGQVRPDPAIGELEFGAALPAAGIVDVTYHLGQWEQRLVRIAGVLRIDACAGAGADAEALGSAAVAAILAPAATAPLRRLHRLGLVSLSSAARQTDPPHRRRTARFAFEFEQEINAPESSGGLIRRIPVENTVETGAPLVVATEEMVVTR